MPARTGSFAVLPTAVVVAVLVVAAFASAEPPKPAHGAVSPSSVAPVRPPVTTFPDLIVLPPTVNSWLVPATGSLPAGYQVVWRVKNQGLAATANRVKLTLACQPTARMAAAPPTPEAAKQICATLDNSSYLSYPPGIPPSTPAPLNPGQESQPFVTLSSTAAVPCKTWHAKVTAVVDPDNAYDEGTGEGNNTRVYEICEMKAFPL